MLPCFQIFYCIIGDRKLDLDLFFWTVYKVIKETVPRDFVIFFIEPTYIYVSSWITGLYGFTNNFIFCGDIREIKDSALCFTAQSQTPSSMYCTVLRAVCTVLYIVQHSVEWTKKSGKNQLVTKIII